METASSEDDAERCVSENVQKSVSTLPKLLHRGTAGNMQPLTGGDDGRMCWDDRWLLILVRSNLKKFSKVVSKRPDFGH